MFVKVAAYQYDVQRFFRKWLRDLRDNQGADGVVPMVAPNGGDNAMAGYGDALGICAFRMYEMYGDKAVLEENFAAMRAWVDYIGHHTCESDLWLHTGPWMVFQGKVAPWLGKHVGDWLALDAAPGSYKGASDEGFLASVYYAHSAELVARAGRVIGRDAEDYQQLHDRIIEKVRLRYPERKTQTEHVVALQFGVSEHPQEEADALAQMVRETGHLTTGFLGTPYLLHALSEYGHADLAWDLLLREEYPSWLYTVKKGATTMWEHWDGIREDGTLWKPDMNSYNHYWTGCVADWVFEKAAGIRPEAPGFTQLTISPLPDERVPSLEAVLDTAQGRIRSAWRHVGGVTRYEIDTPIPANIILDGVCRQVQAGHYIF